MKRFLREQHIYHDMLVLFLREQLIYHYMLVLERSCATECSADLLLYKVALHFNGPHASETNRKSPLSISAF